MRHLVGSLVYALRSFGKSTIADDNNRLALVEEFEDKPSRIRSNLVAAIRSINAFAASNPAGVGRDWPAVAGSYSGCQLADRFFGPTGSTTGVA